ncbi:MAG TPA: MarR family transcriptional regulator, partial [Enterococcus faecalis]|nr:MarR family transcriptional regulator [Enterococcus faecalis]
MSQQQEALKAYIGLLRTSHQLEQLAKQDVTCYDLNITEFSVLELLLHKGPQTIQKI